MRNGREKHPFDSFMIGRCCQLIRHVIIYNVHFMRLISVGLCGIRATELVAGKDIIKSAMYFCVITLAVEENVNIIMKND